MCSTKSGEFCENPRESRTFVYFCQNGYYKKTIPVTKAILMPITGRRHQLRVHCCDINQPILGDFTYGNDYDKTMNRMCLHAARINVPDQLDLSTSDPFIGTSFDGLTIDIEKIYSEIQALKQLLLQ
ncbi:RPUSD1 family protein [Megaselia abdita]